MDEIDSDFNDGAVAVVGAKPTRKPRIAREIPETVKASSGGKLAHIRHLAEPLHREFISLRLPTGAARIAFAHLPVFKAVWRLNMRKRANGEPEGARATEIAVEAHLPLTKVQNVIVSLRKSGIIRSVTQYAGWAKVQAFHYGTELGNQLLALAEFLGPDAAVQVGKTKSAWTGRSQTEPESFFRHIELLRGAAI